MIGNSVVVILGLRGSGKSFLVKECVAARDRVIVIDSRGEYGRDCEIPAARCQESWGVEASLAALEHAEHSRTFRHSLRVVETEGALDVLEVCYELTDYLLVIEEASLYCRPFELPQPVAQLIRYGRHRGIDLIFVARRPSELHRDVTAQADLLVSFTQKEPRDLVYFAAYAGDRARAVQHLPRRQFLAFGELDHAPVPVLARLIRQEDHARIRADQIGT